MEATSKLRNYFIRIGYTCSPEVNLETLTELHRLHTLSIPFENLSPFLHQQVLLDQESLYEKLVTDKRGGYCFEQNLFFMEILKELGFSVRGLGARVLWNRSDEEIPRRSHMMLAVEIGTAMYLADVGFGGLTLTTPVRLEEGLEQVTSHEKFRIVSGENDFRLQALVDSNWKSLYSFDTQEQFLVDYEVTNYFLSTHPTSPFRSALIAARPVPGGRLALNNRQFSIYTLGQAARRVQLGSVDEIKETLVKQFGVNISRLKNLDERLSEIFYSNES